VIVEKEREKYQAAWGLADYHKVSPGEKYADIFATYADPESKVLDLGCGAGAGGNALEKLGYKVTFCDLDNWGNVKPFIKSCIWELPHFTTRWEWIYCCDVLEHIPSEFIALSLDKIRVNSPNAFLSIGLTEDHFGKVIGEPLHLTVRPFTWWRDFLKEFGEVENARDCQHTGIYVVSF